jgi:hypothetical protein
MHMYECGLSQKIASQDKRAAHCPESVQVEAKLLQRGRYACTIDTTTIVAALLLVFHVQKI